MRLHLLLSLLFNRVSVVRMSALAAPFISVHDEAPKTYPKISENEPVVTVTGFHDIGIICSDITQSKDFYEKIGFNLVAEKTSDKVTVLCNKGGMEAHLSVCDKPIDDDLNILMDYPVNKYPGHTHASFQVPNVASTQTYLESQAIAISGDRTRAGKLYGIFARDPDRTTLEFEKNHGDPEDVVVTRDMIGYPQRMDHVGIRVFDPEEALVWYAEILGFNLLINRYEKNPDPLKNGPPWIIRTPCEDPSQPNCDVNLIINANEKVTPGVNENILWVNGVVRPGLFVLGLNVNINPDQGGVSMSTIETKLKSKGVHVVAERDLASSKWACLKDKILPSADGNTLFLEDRECTLMRLWPQ